jgi:thiol-disulfide isomerase/thioredoxin
MRFAILAAALLLMPACQKAEAPGGNASAETAEAGPVKGVDRSHKGGAPPDATFSSPDGEETRLGDLGGPLLVNLWATWCAPCVKELPTLNVLAGKQAGVTKVLAISQDMGPQASVEAFLAKLNADDLEAYHDPKMGLSGALGAEVLPTTILYDAQGKEVWRYVGDLDWTGPEAAKLLAEAGAPAIAR